MLVSAYSLFILNVGMAMDFLSKLRIYLDVFQNSFELDCSLVNRCLRLLKYSCFEFLISFTTLFRNVLNFTMKSIFEVFLNFLYMRFLFLIFFI